MDNQDIRWNQVIIVNESEKNSRLVSLEGTRAKERKSSAKERGKNLPQILFQSYLWKVKTNVERENPLQMAALPGKSSQKLHYTQWRKRNMVIKEDVMILQLLVIHPHPMEAIQKTHNMRGLKSDWRWNI